MFALAVVLGVVGAAPSASAHTGFESSTPAEGETVDQPVSEIVIRFTGPAEEAGEGFVVRAADGSVREPNAVDVVDDRVFTLRFDPPLAGGAIGVRWSVRAPDAHPIDGSFAFTVTAPVPTTVDPTAVESGATPTTVPAVVSAADGDSEQGVPAASLDDFLTTDPSVPGETTSLVGRVVSFSGLTVSVGALAFTAVALRGRRSEVVGVLTSVRWLGGVLAVGAAIEFVGVTRIAGDGLADALTSQPGFAAVLRLAGGLILFGTLRPAVLPIIPLAHPVSRTRPDVRPLSAAVVEQPLMEGREQTSRRMRWSPGAESWPVGAAVATLLLSFWFDGHTVSKGIRPLHAVVNTIHVAAGSVWVGGVIVMAVLAWTRHRSERPTRMTDLVVRFSSVATVALVAVAAAGLVLAVLVADSFGELTGTPWGRVLLLKTGAVALAALGGAYNHFRLVPALESDPDSPELHAELRSTLTAEAIMLGFVVVVTAWLVVQAS